MPLDWGMGNFFITGDEYRIDSLTREIESSRYGSNGKARMEALESTTVDDCEPVLTYSSWMIVGEPDRY